MEGVPLMLEADRAGPPQLGPLVFQAKKGIERKKTFKLSLPFHTFFVVLSFRVCVHSFNRTEAAAIELIDSRIAAFDPSKKGRKRKLRLPLALSPSLFTLARVSTTPFSPLPLFEKNPSVRLSLMSAFLFLLFGKTSRGPRVMGKRHAMRRRAITGDA
jgi:hypothetical protein